MTPLPRATTPSPGPLGRFSFVVLVGAFAIIAAGFIASAFYGEMQSATIDDDVAGIETNSLPSVEHVTAASTALRQLEIEVDQYALRAPADREHEWRTASSARRDLDRELASYLETPMYPGERPLYLEVKGAVASLDGALSELYELAATSPARAQTFANDDLRAAFREADRALRSLASLNAAELHGEVTRIAGVRHRAVRLALLLDSACVLLSIAAALMALRALRRQQAVERAHEQVLESRASELELFAKRVAHDLLSPLAALGFTLSTVRRNEERGDSIAEPLARANACLKRSQRLVDGVLDFARAGSAPTTSPGRVEMRHALDGVLEEVHADEASVAEIVVEPFDDVLVACSAGVLTSVLSNLVRNALKYMGERDVRRITVRIASSAGRVHVEVEDTGPGLAPGLEALVFEPYVRAPDNVQPGLGLGLSTVRRFVEAHGGKVGVHSFLGQGCVFWFELPCAHAPMARPSDQAPALMQ